MMYVRVLKCKFGVYTLERVTHENAPLIETALDYPDPAALFGKILLISGVTIVEILTLEEYLERLNGWMSLPCKSCQD